MRDREVETRPRPRSPRGSRRKRSARRLLVTREHKRGSVRDVSEILVRHGAPESILVDARPHIGSNRLPQVVASIRDELLRCGVQFRFGARVTGLRVTGSSERRVEGVRLRDGSEMEARQVVLARVVRDRYRRRAG